MHRHSLWVWMFCNGDSVAPVRHSEWPIGDNAELKEALRWRASFKISVDVKLVELVRLDGEVDSGRAAPGVARLPVADDVGGLAGQHERNPDAAARQVNGDLRA